MSSTASSTRGSRTGPSSAWPEMGLTSNIKLWRGPASAAKAGAPRRRVPSWRSIAGLAAAWLVLGTAWEAGARLGVLNPAILPPPSQFIPYLIETSGSVGLGVNKVSYAAALVATVIRVGVGFGLGIGSGLIVGTLLSAIPWARVIGVPIAQILAPIAPIAWIPVLAGEMAGINSGLGSLVILGQQEFQMKLVMAGLVTIGILGFGFDRLLLLLRQRLLWWEARGARAAAADA